MKNKKGMSTIWKIAIFIILILIIIFVVYSYTLNSDPDNLVPDSNSISGNVILDQNPLTNIELKEGVSLNKGWNVFIWTKDPNKKLAPATAFSSILPNTEFVYNYDALTYYFSPNGRFERFNTHAYYRTRLLTEIEPGNKYGVLLKNDDVLEYEKDNDESSNDNFISPLCLWADKNKDGEVNFVDFSLYSVCNYVNVDDDTTTIDSPSS